MDIEEGAAGEILLGAAKKVLARAEVPAGTNNKGKPEK